ncbi:hypothetical protein GCM10009647_046910 [Streptomyces sanglieri]|uniref:Uncharacterized protein n=1 Tax=Streptomyces sanglieri TaxID=193460 RepID=A0ABW2WMV0_9ACTN|nr:hypothetical protein [Streptomyces sp. Wh19]MDV9198184.1 hypothetical protein [Streptomyces sp. Wh19]
MTSNTDESRTATEPPGDLEKGWPGGPEYAPRPYVRLMAAIGTIGIAAAVAAAVVGLTTDPVLRLPETMPSMPTPGQTSLPTGFPTALPTDLPTDYTKPTQLPSGFLPSGFTTDLPTDFPSTFPTGFPTDVPGLPSGFPSLPELPQDGGAS